MHRQKNLWTGVVRKGFVEGAGKFPQAEVWNFQPLQQVLKVPGGAHRIPEALRQKQGNLWGALPEVPPDLSCCSYKGRAPTGGDPGMNPGCIARPLAGRGKFAASIGRDAC